MIEVTKQQRANALEALNVMWPSVPQKNVNLRLWRKDLDAAAPPRCGTIACFGGWCAWWPSFRAQGVFANSDGAPRTRETNWASQASHELFGDWLFSPRDARRDTETDHEVVTKRLRRLIRNSRVV